MTALFTGFVAICVAVMARELKVSEFRQAWINGLRDELSEFTTKAHEWMELYLDTNAHQDQKHKEEMHSKLNGLKYESFRAFRKIQLRFKPSDVAGNNLLDSLQDLLDPGKVWIDPQDTKGKTRYGAWRDMADETILQARHLLKEEWETTKNPLRRALRKLKNIRASL